MAHQSFAKTVLETALALATKSNGEVSADAVSMALGLKTHLEHKRMLNTLSDLYQAKRIHRVRQGVYGPMPTIQPPDKRQVMWRILRMRRRVTVADLVEMAGVSAEYAKEWLRMLTRMNVVRKHQPSGMTGSWQLLNDTVAMPEDDNKAARLRELRQQKKQAAALAIDSVLTNLLTIGKALSRARDAINTMEEGE